ncbi:MAG: hypothetical protein PHV30_11235 [Candidatus Margulisbacteria bacterium]|nr:hypothetical protein [Candidatus Margulisiibacteriota bacterium]
MNNKVIAIQTDAIFLQKLWSDLKSGFSTQESYLNPIFLLTIDKTRFGTMSAKKHVATNTIMYDALERRLNWEAEYQVSVISLSDIKRGILNLLQKLGYVAAEQKQSEFYDKWDNMDNVSIDDISRYISILQDNNPLYKSYSLFPRKKQPLDLEKSAKILETLISKACNVPDKNKLFIEKLGMHIFTRENLILKDNNQDAMNDLALLIVLAAKFENILYKNLTLVTIFKDYKLWDKNHADQVKVLLNKCIKLDSDIINKLIKIGIHISKEN